MGVGVGVSGCVGEWVGVHLWLYVLCTHLYANVSMDPWMDGWMDGIQDGMWMDGQGWTD